MSRIILDDEFVRDELFPWSLMPGNHACDGLAAGVAIADPDAYVVAYPQSLTMACVVDLDLDRSHGDKLACLPRPWEVPLGVAAEPTAEDPLECGALLAERRASR